MTTLCRYLAVSIGFLMLWMTSAGGAPRGESSAPRAVTALETEGDRMPGGADRLARKAADAFAEGRIDEAFRAALAALGLDPGHAGAHYWAGRCSAWWATHPPDPEEGEVLYGRDHYRREAERHFDETLSLAPDHRPARLALCRVLYDAGDLDRFSRAVAAYRELGPNRAEPWFLQSLGEQAAGDTRAAYLSFIEGLSRLSGADSAYVRSLGLLARDGKEAALQPEALRSFWAARDPLYLTPVNERLKEHFSRVVYAELWFGDPFGGIPGWETDRGEVYVRYGQPVGRVARPAEVGFVEVWDYAELSAAFRANGEMGPWTLAHARHGDRVHPTMASLADDAPERYRDPYWFQRFEIACQVAQFRGADGQTRLEVYYALPCEHVAARDLKPGVRAVNLESGLFVFSRGWEGLVRRVQQIEEMPWVSSGLGRSGVLMWGERLALPEGDYTMVVEAEDRKGQGLGSLRRDLAVRRFGRDALEISSLLLSRRIVRQEEMELGRDSFRILPNPERRCGYGEPIAVYLEVYNLVRDASGSSRCRLSWKTRPTDGSEGNWEELGSEVHTVEGEWLPHQLRVRLPALDHGEHVLRVVVDDLVAGRQAEAEEAFLVSR